MRAPQQQGCFECKVSTPGRCAAAESPPDPRPSGTRVLAILGAACGVCTGGTRDPRRRAPRARRAVGGDGDTDTRAEGPVKRRRGREGCVHKPRTAGCAGSPQKPAEATALPTPGFQTLATELLLFSTTGRGASLQRPQETNTHSTNLSRVCPVSQAPRRFSRVTGEPNSAILAPGPAWSFGPSVLRFCEETEPRAADTTRTSTPLPSPPPATPGKGWAHLPPWHWVRLPLFVRAKQAPGTVRRKEPRELH